MFLFITLLYLFFPTTNSTNSLTRADMLIMQFYKIQKADTSLNFYGVSYLYRMVW